MKLVLTVDEVKELLLHAVNETFTMGFNEVTFDGYSPFKTATFEVIKPEPKEAPRDTR